MNGETYIKKHRSFNNFTVLPNEVVKDKRLTWAAIGLLSYLISLPPDFKVRLYNLSSIKPGCGRDATRSALAKLEAAGYVELVREREAGKFTKTTWFVSNVSSIPDPP